MTSQDSTNTPSKQTVTTHVKCYLRNSVPQVLLEEVEGERWYCQQSLSLTWSKVPDSWKKGLFQRKSYCLQRVNYCYQLGNGRKFQNTSRGPTLQVGLSKNNSLFFSTNAFRKRQPKANTHIHTHTPSMMNKIQGYFKQFVGKWKLKGKFVPASY